MRKAEENEGIHQWKVEFEPGTSAIPHWRPIVKWFYYNCGGRVLKGSGQATIDLDEYCQGIEGWNRRLMQILEQNVGACCMYIVEFCTVAVYLNLM